LSTSRGPASRAKRSTSSVGKTVSFSRLSRGHHRRSASRRRKQWPQTAPRSRASSAHYRDLSHRYRPCPPSSDRRWKRCHRCRPSPPPRCCWSRSRHRRRPSRLPRLEVNPTDLACIRRATAYRARCRSTPAAPTSAETARARPNQASTVHEKPRTAGQGRVASDPSVEPSGFRLPKAGPGGVRRRILCVRANWWARHTRFSLPLLPSGPGGVQAALLADPQCERLPS
jgi:hypothetical protein